MNIPLLLENIKKGQITALARGITLVESSRDQDWPLIKELMSSLKNDQSRSQRLGFSGPPGVGKSSFIEQLGQLIISNNQKVAVLAVDPSSEISGGSILGDKTRMEELSRSPQAFVRPSATRGHLGGVTSRLPGVIRLCEVAGFHWVFIESVGVGQSEVELSQMVDIFTLISQPGAGDELQGIKRGILEYVDLILVNKADRNPGLVNTTRQQYLSALKILRKKKVEVLPCSALKGDGIKEALQFFEEFVSRLDLPLKDPMAAIWYESLILTEFRKRMKNPGPWNDSFSHFLNEVENGQLTPIEAVDSFFQVLSSSKTKA